MQEILTVDANHSLVGGFAVSLEPVGSRHLEKQIALVKQSGKEILSLKGGPSRPLPEHIREVVAQSLDEGSIRPSRGILELRRAITDLLGREVGIRLDPERHVMITNGAMQALNVVFRTLLQAGDRVVIPSPAFFFGGIVQLAGGEPVYVPCAEDDQWRWNLEQIAQAIDARTKVLIACNPSNPTGYLPSAEELQALLALAKDHNIIVVADESYKRFIYDDATFTSAATLLGTYDNLVLVSSLSKDYAIPNWRMGYIVASEAVISACLKLMEWECLHCAYVNQRVAAAAIQGPQDWLVDLPVEYERNRDIAYRAVQQSGLLSCVLPKAAPFLYVNVSRLGQPCDIIAQELLEATGIATVSGGYFQMPGYLRLPFGGSLETIQRMADLLQRWVASKAPKSSRVGDLR